MCCDVSASISLVTGSYLNPQSYFCMNVMYEHALVLSVSDACGGGLYGIM